MKIENPKKVIIYLASGLISIILFFLIIRKKPVENKKDDTLDEIKTLVKDNSEKLRNEFNNKIKNATKKKVKKVVIDDNDADDTDDSELADDSISSDK